MSNYLMLVGKVIIGIGAMLTASLFVFGCSPAEMVYGKPPPPPTITQHEGNVSKVVVVDPHTGGWSGRASNPRTVILTVNGTDYDLEGPLAQAATVKPGDRVRIECRQYEGSEPFCEFGGTVTTVTPSAKPTTSTKAPAAIAGIPTYPIGVFVGGLNAGRKAAQ